MPSPAPVPPTVLLDHAASTPLRPEVLARMVELLSGSGANSTGAHGAARAARRVVEEARDELAGVLNVAPSGVVFTATGTEADNLAVKGLSWRKGDRGTVVCSAVEHHAVLHPVVGLGGRTVGVDRHGRVDLDALRDALDESVSLVSVMAVNNEIGTIESMAGVAAVVRDHAPRARLHCDAVQAHTWIDTAALAAHVDALSLSAHKFGGPTGAGALVLTRDVAVRAEMDGGGQEQERRSGTHDVASIGALAMAARLAAQGRAETVSSVARRRDRLVDGLQGAVDGVHETVERSHKVAGNAHVCIEGVESEVLLFMADRAGIYASPGASCSSGAVAMSHVLEAIGVPKELGRGAVRFTLGWDTTDADIERALDVLPDLIRRCRR